MALRHLLYVVLQIRRGRRRQLVLEISSSITEPARKFCLRVLCADTWPWRGNFPAAQGREYRPPARRSRRESARRKLWGKWFGKEEEYFIACYETAKKLSADEAKNICGVRMQIHQENVTRMIKGLWITEAPEDLRRNPKLGVSVVPDGRYQLIAYSGLDPVLVSETLYRLIEKFDGRQSTSETIRMMKEAGAPVPGKSLLLKLYHSRILVSARGTDSS